MAAGNVVVEDVMLSACNPTTCLGSPQATLPLSRGRMDGGTLVVQVVAQVVGQN
jgi:hypothetical protein